MSAPVTHAPTSDIAALCRDVQRLYDAMSDRLSQHAMGFVEPLCADNAQNQFARVWRPLLRERVQHTVTISPRFRSRPIST